MGLELKSTGNNRPCKNPCSICSFHHFSRLIAAKLYNKKVNLPILRIDEVSAVWSSVTWEGAPWQVSKNVAETGDSKGKASKGLGNSTSSTETTQELCVCWGHQKSSPSLRRG